jgi:uncharacterized UPF0160 family protein
MSTVVATHSGPFHADDVVAWALIRTFHDPDAEVVRTRDPEIIDRADLVIDVGGLHDPGRGRFDHHQASYTGPRSSAGMVLDWLEARGDIATELAERLRSSAFDYLDDVDNGRVAPRQDVPCFPRIVDALNQPASTEAQFDAAFLTAGDFATAWVHGLRAEYEGILDARRTVVAAMEDAVEQGRRVVFLDRYLPWKPVYFEHGGEEHPTDYVLFPGTDGSWRVVAIPPRLGDFGQKRPLPEAWAGLTDQALEHVTGVAGSVFCHKNRFIAVFQTRDGALQALRSHDLLQA